MATTPINVYNQMAAFNDLIWGIPDIKPRHISLYWFLMNQANLNHWHEWFPVARDLGMFGGRISKRSGHSGFSGTVDDLVKHGLIKYIKARNQYEFPMFSIICLYQKGGKQGGSQPPKRARMANPPVPKRDQAGGQALDLLVPKRDLARCLARVPNEDIKEIKTPEPPQVFKFDPKMNCGNCLWIGKVVGGYGHCPEINKLINVLNDPTCGRWEEKD